MWRVRFVTPVTLEAEERRAEPRVGWRRAAPPSADRGELSRQAAAQSGNSNRTQQQQQTHTNTLLHSDTHRHTHAHAQIQTHHCAPRSARSAVRTGHTHTRLHSTKVTCCFYFCFFVVINRDILSSRDADECENDSR